MNTNRYVVEPGVNPRNNKRCFYVVDSISGRTNLPGVGTPIRTKDEAEYLAWVLNSQGSNTERQTNG